LSNPPSQFAIQADALTRRFQRQTAVDQLSIQVAAGSVLGFLGPNGAGKTTTIRMLAGLIAPTSGAATVGGHRVGTQSGAIRRSVGLLTESPGLYEKLTPRQNLAFFGQLYGLSVAEATSRADRYLRFFGLWERRDDPVGGFSKGMRQKVAITRALLHDPAIIFLDEPTAGLDPEAARAVRDLVRQMRADGRTVFLTTHNLSEVEDLCDTIAIFRTRLLAIGAPAALRDRLYGRGTVVRLAGDAAAWRDAVSDLPFVRAAAASGETLTLTIDDPDTHNPALVERLAARGAPIRYVEPLSHSLEQVYLELLGSEERPI
jgi:ABC-2 type transport system ATP-binding protein